MQQTTDSQIKLSDEENNWLEEFLSTNDISDLVGKEAPPKNTGNNSGIVQIDNFNQIKKNAIHLYAANRFKDASKAIEDAIRLLPGDLELNFFHAQCLARMGETNRAITILQNLLTVDEYKSFIHLPRLLAYLLLKSEKYNEAENTITALLESYGNDIQLRNMLGFSKERKDKLNEAEKIFTQILSEDSHNANAANSLAYIYYRKKKNLKEALELTQIAVTSEKRNPAYLDTYGMVQFWAGNKAAARNALQEALELSPDNGVILLHLSEILES